MVNEESRGGQLQSPFLSPSELIKQRVVGLMFDCINLNAQSYNQEKRYEFVKKVKDLMIQLTRYTPKSKQQELIQWYDQMNTELESIKQRPHLTDQERDKELLNKMYEYSLDVHEHNQRILLNSPIVEIEVEGELDITDDEAIAVIRGGKRTDDKRIIAK